VGSPSVVDGIAMIENKDIASARVAAINDAQKKAVNQFIFALVPSDIIMNNYKIIEEKIYSRIIDFITSYKVISESPEGDIFHVRVEIILSEEILKQALSEAGLLFYRGDSPKVLVMISEQDIDGGFGWWWGKSENIKRGICESTIEEIMRKRGFAVIDPGMVVQRLQNVEEIQKRDLPFGVLVKIGKNSGADMVVFGECILHKGVDVEGSSLKSYKANLNVRAIYVPGEKTIFNDNGEAWGIHSDPMVSSRNSFKKVADLVGEKVVQTMETYWKDEVIKLRNIIVELIKPEKLGDVQTILEATQKVENVKNARMRAFSPQSSIIEVDILNLSTESLAGKILENIGDKQRYSIKSITSDRIVFSLNTHPQQ
jgi:hypothetical protein